VHNKERLVRNKDVSKNLRDTTGSSFDEAIEPSISRKPHTAPLYPSVAPRDMAKLEALGLDKPTNGWESHAVCAQTDPEVFFPKKGGSTRKSKNICLSCPVQKDCLANALIHNYEHGILGGKSAGERRALNRKAKDIIAKKTDGPI